MPDPIISRPAIRRELIHAKKLLDRDNLSDQERADITQLVTLLGHIAISTSDIVRIATTEEDL